MIIHINKFTVSVNFKVPISIQKVLQRHYKKVSEKGIIKIEGGKETAVI